jgi:hypothetical protein
VEGVSKIHSLNGPVERFCRQRRILQSDALQTGKIVERSRDTDRGETIDAAQHPFGFKQNRRADEHIFTID